MVFGLFSSGKIKKLLKDAQQAYKEGERDKSIDLYKQVLKLEKNNEEAKENLKIIYREKETLRAIFTITEKVSQQKQDDQPQNNKIVNKESNLSEKSGIDRRIFARAKDNRYVDFRLLKKSEIGSIAEGRALDKNISAGGLLLLIEEDVISLGTFLELKFEFPDGYFVYTVGKVIRKDKVEEEGKQYIGLGTKFTNISKDDQKRINEIIKNKT